MNIITIEDKPLDRAQINNSTFVGGHGLPKHSSITLHCCKLY